MIEIRRTRICLTCGLKFSYLIGRGMDRVRCSNECREKNKKANKPNRLALLPECKIIGCGRKATRIRQRTCERCYMQIRRTGVVRLTRVYRYRYSRRDGYVLLYRPGHALADSRGYVFEHRHVAYSVYQGHCPACFWCGSALTWNSAHIDHLNEDKADNSEKNLVVACCPCNRARGSILPFIERLLPDSLERFIGLVREIATRRNSKGHHHTREKAM